MHTDPIPDLTAALAATHRGDLLTQACHHRLARLAACRRPSSLRALRDAPGRMRAALVRWSRRSQLNASRPCCDWPL